MASPSSAAIFILFLLSTAWVLPSEAQLPQLIKAIKVGGILYCSPDGNYCPTCQGLVGVNVTIACNIGSNNYTTYALTGPDGVIDTLLGCGDGFFLGITPISCVATVQLPVLNCALLPTTGILQAPLTLTVNVIVSLLGLCVEAFIGVFVHLTA
ncbi:repetitive proline-rich cell wall protein 2-like [Dorcoceras hygrometricum]|uniref:Repetitive proline-rich cell wall protein 2-like n=1 Tax=Dorcoceras hygrometricum TaxID=472368 RepID=A0A2Z7AST6_9LAMI|nr:repetitive proline-rich cell wall protein 2-like [Dorcoceras hygrometricum]